MLIHMRRKSRLDCDISVLHEQASATVHHTSTVEVLCPHNPYKKKIKITSLNMGYISISLSNKALVQVVAPQWKNTQFQVLSVEMQGSSKELEKKRRLVLVH